MKRTLPKAQVFFALILVGIMAGCASPAQMPVLEALHELGFE